MRWKVEAVGLAWAWEAADPCRGYRDPDSGVLLVLIAGLVEPVVSTAGLEADLPALVKAKWFRLVVGYPRAWLAAEKMGHRRAHSRSLRSKQPDRRFAPRLLPIAA